MQYANYFEEKNKKFLLLLLLLLRLFKLLEIRLLQIEEKWQKKGESAEIDSQEIEFTKRRRRHLRRSFRRRSLLPSHRRRCCVRRAKRPLRWLPLPAKHCCPDGAE